MANEVLIYSPIYDFVAEQFIKELNEAGDADLTVRVNSPGGSVFAGWGMIAKSKEYKGNIKVKVDGNASSMASVFLLFHKDVEALEVSKFTLHRASVYNPSAQDKLLLDSINSDIRKAFESKLHIPRFEQIAGCSMDEFFTSDDVIDVYINAQQAAEIGLIDKIVPMDANAFNDISMRIAAVAKKETKPKSNKNENKMTLSELKEKHADVFAAAKAEIETAAIANERDRVNAWMEFGDVDFQAVKEGIAEGKEISRQMMAEMAKKQFVAERKADAEKESAKGVETPEAPKDEPTAIDTFMAEVRNTKK